MKKFITGLAATAVMAGILTGCGNNSSSGTDDEKEVLKVAALEGGYGKEMYEKVIEAYEAENPDVDVQLTISKSIEDEITPNMKAGNYPNVIVLGQGREAALTETLIKENALEDLSDVLVRTVPGEDVTVGDKLIDGIVGNLNTNPYGDDKTYLMPMYYSPTGLVYNQGLFEEKGWELPSTWDEMFELGEKAKAEDISLFTYPTAGYLDSYFYSLFATVGGMDFYHDVMTYAEGVWKTENATKVLEITSELLSFTSETTVANANEQNFTKNQQMILSNEAVFMPNGTWIVGEMADAPHADGFEWGMMPLPALEDGGQRYIVTSVESVWIPTEANNKETAKDFIAFLYSDKAAEIFAESDAVQPIQGITDLLSDENKAFYSIYEEENVSALVGGFASTTPVEGVDMKSTLFDTVNSIITGNKNVEQWQEDLDTASEKLREAS